MPLPRMHLWRPEQTVTATPKFIQLGNQAYADTYEKMRSLVQADSFDDEIWLLEHDAVFTLGTAADPSHVLNPGNIPIVQTDRGGEVTFHGPGQLVIYFLLDIKTKKDRSQGIGRQFTKPYSKYSATLLHREFLC